MRLFSLAFLLGIMLLNTFSHLPSAKWISINFLIVLGLLAFYRHKKFIQNKILKQISTLIIALICGFSWCLWYTHWQTAWQLPDEIEGKTIEVTGNIVSIPNKSDSFISFLFKVKKIYYQHQNYPANVLVKLTWRTDENALHVGDQWKLSIRLKRIHGTQNPGSFDYEAWALHEGIRAQGYVVAKEENHFLKKEILHHPLDRLRELIKNKINTSLPTTETSPWITALVVGERNNISQDQWEILRNTGTNHLMAIAGLHIGFMSGFAYWLATWLARRKPSLLLKLPLQHIGSIAALVTAFLYSALAGFSIPTQRACMMLSVFLVIVILKRKTLAWQAWSLALMMVLILNPLSVLTESFWLSFGAVAFIILGVSGRLSPKGLWWKYGRIQWVITLGLIPLSLIFFQQISLVSLAANFIAIPWVGFIIVPLSLLGSFVTFFSTQFGGYILVFADMMLGMLWKILTWFSHLTWASWYHAVPDVWIFVSAVLGIILLLMPRGFPGRFFGLITLLPLIIIKPATPRVGEAWFTLLDVGQGLAAVVQTHQHTLVFDAGPKFNSHSDMGESVVVPFLRTKGVKQVDMLVVSHGDNDHIGGTGALLKNFPVKEIKTSVPEKFPSRKVSYCLKGQAWQWDGVKFQFLYPTAENLGLNNDSSCVLRITAHDKNILLTGDIEKFAEKVLVANQNDLAANLLIAPHHGSKTSSAVAFLEKVHPECVLFPIGYRNRYHFPHTAVIERYDDLHVAKMDTAQEGAIQCAVNENSIFSDMSGYRHKHARYWNEST